MSKPTTPEEPTMEFYDPSAGVEADNAADAAADDAAFAAQFEDDDEAAPAARPSPEAVARYLELRARMDRLVAAEDRAFVRYMQEPTPSRAGSARSARSRVNAISAELYSAEAEAMDDDGNLPDGRQAS